jgi:hypothetical protein
MPRLGLDIHEYPATALHPRGVYVQMMWRAEANSWMARPSLAMTR